MAKLFFLLSGEHPTLPFSELISILDAEGYQYRISMRLKQVLGVETSVDGVKSVKFRSAMTRVCCLELFRCNALLTEILKNIRLASLEGFIKSGESFVVRLRRVMGAAPHIVGAELERKLGELILKKAEKTKVSLKAPQKTFFGVLTENKFVFGLRMAEISPKPFVDRRPRERPFFHPTAMSAKLARCMVNLAQAKAGELVVDPFCGTASILTEAWLVGCRVLGFDVQPHMVRGGLRNLLHYGVKPEGIAVADARNLPVAKINCVVTDPPYGRSATTLGQGTRKIVEEFLSAVKSILPKGKRICMASPKYIQIGKIGEELGFRHVESHVVYVHKSLTRQIAVFQRT